MHGVQRPDSVLIGTDLETDRKVHQDLVQCVHCGRHWPIGKSIGQIVAGKLELGYCARCGGITCPCDRCQKCVPIEQQLDNVEADQPIDHRPTTVGFPGLTLFN